MPEKSHPCTGVFEAGYEKGRSDALKHAIMVLQLAVESYPGRLTSTARAILPQEIGVEISEQIHSFGEHCFRQGRKVEKEKQATAAKQNEAS